MPRVTEEHRAAMRERIHEAAIAVIERKGLGAMTMGDIITESGLSAGAIYVYYPGKAELTRAVAESVLGQRRSGLETFTSSTPPPHPADVVARILASLPTPLVLQFWAAVTSDPGVRAIATDMLSEVEALVDGYLVRWLAAQGHDEDACASRARELTPVLLGLVQGYGIRLQVRPETGADEYVAGVRRVLDGDLAARPT